MRRSRLLVSLLASAMLLAGCNKQPDDKQADDEQVAVKADKKADDEAKADPPKAGPVLTIGAAKIMPKGQPDKAVELMVDGTVKLSASTAEGWKITPDGKVRKADGTIIAEVGADGSVKIGGRSSGIVLNDKGLTLSSPDGRTVTMVFAESGDVMMEPPPEPGMAMTSEGCRPGVAKTCALVLSLYLLAAGDASDGASAAEAPVEAPGGGNP